MVLCSPLKLLSRLSCFIDGVNLMDEGGVQFYLDHVVVLHDSGAMLEGREGVGEEGGNKWRERKGVGEEGRGGGDKGRGGEVDIITAH